MTISSILSPYYCSRDHRQPRHPACRSTSPVWLALLCCVLSGMAAPHFAHALPVARLLQIQPSVQVKDRSSSQFVAVRERYGLEYGDTVRTGKRAKARLAFANGTALTMNENTNIQIEAPRSSNSPLVIRVFGRLSSVFVRPKGNTQVRTAAAIAAARGTALLVRLPTDDSMILNVTEDSVHLFNAQGSVTVNANEQSTATVGSAPTPPVAFDASGLIEWTADISGLPVEFETPFISLDTKALATQLGAQSATVQANPDDAVAHARLGEVLHDLGEFSSAVAEFSRAVELSPQNATFHYGLGQARRGAGDAPGAIAAYRRALELAPNESNPRLGLALAHLSLGENQAATDALQPIQNSPRAQAIAGLIALRQGDNEGAATQLRSALAADANLYQAQSLLALALLQQGRGNEAVVAASAAARQQPQSAQAQGVLSMVLFFDRQTDEAARAAQRAIDLNPLSPFALITQGRISLAQQRLDQARDAFQQAQALAPNLPLTHTELGAVYVQLDMLPRAERSFRRALELDPKSADAMTGLGAVLYLQGKIPDAITQHQAAIAANPRNSTAIANLAELYIREGRLDEAETLLDEARLEQPERGILYARLSEISLMRQQLHSAQEFARRAVTLLAGSAIAHYQLGRVYLEQGRTAQAEQQFREAVNLDPDFAEARYALGLTREIVETGRDATRPSALPNPNRIGSAATAQNLQNLQTPGAEERIKAAILDPTVVRVASRSFGNSQLDGILGQDDTHFLGFSHLRETGNRRGVRGVTIERNQADIDRPNADTETNRVSVIIGQKASDNASSLFFLGQYEQFEQGLNRGNLGLFSAGGRDKIQKPLFVFGGNLQSSQRSRTRFLLQYINPQLKGRGLLNGSESNTEVREVSAELRHDLLLGTKHYLSAGVGLGRIRSEFGFFFGGVPAVIPDQQFINGTRVRIASAYVRDEFRASNRLTVTGELRVQKSDVDSSFQPILPLPGPTTTTNQADKTSVLPNFIARYRLTQRSALRFRARRLAGTVRDFNLLSPTDLFALSFTELPNLDFRAGSGRSFELEYNHTFRNASFLRIGVFDQHLNRARDLSVDGSSGATLPRVRLRGVQAGFEGLIGQDTSFYTNLNLTSAKDRVFNQDVANIPQWSAEAGVQYLNRQGWFVQPSIFYQDDRTRVDRSQASSVALINLRAGKRFGLRSVVFAEVVNIGNKSYDILEVVQPGRQFRIGATQRF